MTTLLPAPAVAEVAPRRWTIEEFERIPDEAITEGERVELIDGLIYTKVGQNDPHCFGLLYAIEALRAVFAQGFVVVSQMPTRFATDSKVEPDILVLRGSLRNYEDRRADPRTDVALVVGVSDTSLAYDTGLKAWLYATQGVPEYWVVNLQNRTLEVHRRPNPTLGGYAEVTIYSEGESAAAGSVEIAVSDLLPKKG